MAQSSFERLVDSFLPEQFSSPIHNFEFVLSKKIKSHHLDMQHLTVIGPFPLEEYLSSQQIGVMMTERHRVHNFDYNQAKSTSTLKVGLLEFNWSGTDFIIYKTTWPEIGVGVQTMYNILFRAPGEKEAEKEKAGEDFIAAIHEWNDALKEEIFVFSQGGWQKDASMWKAIQLATWNNLVLDPDFVGKLKRDTDTFFSSHEVYKSLDIPWKRGILLLGPTGNGKTESIKVLLKECGFPALYVKSLDSGAGSEYGIRGIFEFARRRAPCILVLEDLDSLVSEYTRSYFLNELDGLDSNEGILTIATSNHPERIDDALLNRPSRFDVKYTFDLPSFELRKSYIAKWVVKVRDLNGIDFRNETFIRELAEQTEGFSFAFMKELFVSFLLRLAHDRTLGRDTSNPEAAMKSQLKQLLAQIEMGEKASKVPREGNGSQPIIIRRSAF